MNRYPADRAFVRAAADAVRRSGHIAISMEDFTAVSRLPASYCQEQVRRCDVYIGVIGFRYGSLVTGGLHGDGTAVARKSGTALPAGDPSGWTGSPAGPPSRTAVSYTELEFLTAVESGIPRLVFLLHEDTPIPRSLTDRNLELVEAFRERLRSAGVTVGTFRTADSLEAQVTLALTQLRHSGEVDAALVAEPGGPKPAVASGNGGQPLRPPDPTHPTGPTTEAATDPAGSASGPDDLVAQPVAQPGDAGSGATGRKPEAAAAVSGAVPMAAGARRRRRLRYVIGAAVLACAVAAGVVLGAGVGWPGSSGACQSPDPVTALPAAATWVGSHDGQCIGFSDGAYTFDSTSPDLVALLTTIGRQNAALAGKGGVYTVVVAAPLTGLHSRPGGGQADSPTTVGQGGLNELLGARLAQAAINAAADAPGARSRSRIRLLVANVGWHSGGALTVAERIDAVARADPGLAGVLGLFQSTAAARRAVALLSGTTHIPIVSSTASDDGFTRPVGPPGHTRRAFDWYFRVGPTNRREAGVIVRAIPEIMKREGRGDEPIRPLIVSAGVVNDAKAANADHYSDNLAQDVSAELRRLPRAAPAVHVPFPDAEQAAAASAEDGGPTVLGVLGHALSARCTAPQPPNLIVYTGRTTSVNTLLQALTGSACGRADPPLPIISGDDAMELETDPGEIAAGAMGGHSFYFADFGLAQPGDIPPSYLEQTGTGGAVPAQWAAQVRGTPQRLISGHTIVAFDAMSVLARAISAAELNTPPPGQLRANVKASLDGTCGNLALAGANGYVSFNRYGDSTTAPVLIRRFDPTDATVTTVAPGTTAESLRRPTAATADCTTL
ncbi:DUF4062 domain-containing protein [Frankia sp. QA3]|uniref:DUF4062 domain-containing protein n=1 Tax=Frankia sp. QA3 TaxID=710111 RepID=UPI001E4073CD|nr:DUF4062 domain-containing protein [Frankia sp. QA3]